MIFVTVGAQMPFDRLVRKVDAWAQTTGRSDVLAQIGFTDWRPAHMDWTAFLDPADYRQRLFEADAVVTHAGMGTILTALEFGKPTLVMPRQACLRETRNDHQFGTARAFAEAGRVAVAWDEQELLGWLSRLESVPAPTRVGSHASLSLLSALRRFVREDAALAATQAAVLNPDCS
ncbi:MAG: glycosyltransferase [Planctomycetota bacterium]